MFQRRVWLEAKQHHRATRYQHYKQRETAAPKPSLCVQREDRFKEQRIGQQCEEASGIGCSVEEIGIVAFMVTRAHEPGLQQWIVRGESEKRQADRHHE